MLSERLHVEILCFSLIFGVPAIHAENVPTPEWQIVGWNDLGMHCMDGTDFSVFSILPPFNTVNAHVLHHGRLVTDPAAEGITVVYRAVADPQGSINSTAADKVNFWEHMADFFGFTQPDDVGLFGAAMPGNSNTPREMHFNPDLDWFTGEGIPITPFDDAGEVNYYPLMQLEVHDGAGGILASNRVVLPVSDEMDCSACHQSGSYANARPSTGWFWHPDPDQDMKLNILRLHDDRHLGQPLYRQSLLNQGFSTNGLLHTSRYAGTSILCARCHTSNALPPVTGESGNGVSRMTVAMHGGHANVPDPITGLPLESSVNRASCYRCHPGSSTLCLRGAMGTAVDASANLSMQCQSCHGSMAEVGSVTRTDWLDQPNCQACHTGTATDNNGQIRYLDAFDGGALRVASNLTFATSPDMPLPGFSLYRFSQGHAGLQCSTCHGSPHAIYPSFHDNDNLQNIDLQGQAGTLGECSVCHDSFPNEPSSLYLAGPHGMHRTGSGWIKEGDNNHKNAVEKLGLASCKACHGADHRGTVLSAALTDQTLSWNDDGRQHSTFFWQGAIIGCWSCHQGPGSGDDNTTPAATVSDVSELMAANSDSVMPLGIANPSGLPLEVRVITPPRSGLAGISNGTHAVYRPFKDFTGTDTFTYAAFNTQKDSNLATVTVTVVEGVLALSCTSVVPSNGLARSSAPFWAEPELSNGPGEFTYLWDFGDGMTSTDGPNTSHAYARTGTYPWQLVVQAAGMSCTNQGTIEVIETILDSDADGIEDDWELLVFQDLATADEQSDFDHDGSLDAHERIAGTDARDETSLLRIDLVRSLDSPARLQVRWTSTTNRSYRICATPDLPAGPYDGIASNLVATPPNNLHEQALVLGEWLNTYRVEVE